MKTKELTVCNVENAFLGVSITERDGITMRRISTEINDVQELQKIRDTIDQLISAKLNSGAAG